MTANPYPWPPGTATGIGSLPGEDVRDAVATVFGELPDLPHLPELPARGPGADLVGRTAALLVDLHVDRQPSGWRLVPRPGRDERRAAAFLRADLDAFEERAEGFTGAVKAQLAGPWTLAAAVELPRGGPALADPGAVRDLTASLVEGLRAHVAEVARRVPGATPLLQLDEPALPAALAGAVPTASGLRRIGRVEAAVAEQALAAAVAAAGMPVVVHCCAATPPIDLLRRAGASGVSVDATALDLARPGPYDDALGEAVEAGVWLWAGVVSTTGVDSGPEFSDPAVIVDPVRRLWRRLGLDPARLASGVVVTPTCGLAEVSPGRARAAMAAARAAGRVLVDEPEG